jgi:hypothetical protein
MPDLEMEMRLLNAPHIASGTCGVGDLICPEPLFAVEHHLIRLEYSPIRQDAVDKGLYRRRCRKFECTKSGQRNDCLAICAERTTKRITRSPERR